jgi:hypothetical protein
VVTSTDRAKVLVNINGVIVPFYLTTGQAGKGLVPGWYPFFGIGKDGWLNKTDKSDMETYYERYWGKETADIVKSISEELNSFYGTNPSTFKNDGDPNATSRPLTTLADKVEDYINSKLNYTPAINNADARKTLRSNVEQLGREINAKYDAKLKTDEQLNETVTERDGAKVAKEKVSAIGEKIKAKLKAKGADGVTKAGLGIDELVDAAVTLIHKAIDAGVSINEAIKTHITDKDWYKGLSDDERAIINEVIAEDMPSEVAAGSESREAAENNEKEKSVVSEDKEEGESKTPLATVAQAFVDSKMEQEKKDELLSDANLALTTMTFEEMKSAGAEIISGFDSVEQAVDEVRKPGTNIPIELRSVILGEGMKYAQTKQKEAKTEAEKNKWADYEIDLVKELTQAARSMGRFNAYIAQLYEQSPYSIVRETKREIEDKNKLFAPDAKQNAKDVKAILENEEDLEASFERAITEAVEISNKERDKKIAELEKKLAQSQKAPSPRPTPKRKYRYSDSDKKKFLDGIKNIRSGGGPLIILNSAISNPELWKNLGGLAGYYIERGYYKFDDFYKKLKKDLGGEFEDSYADLYNEAKQVATENGVDPKEFDGDTEVERLAQEKLNEEQRLKDEIAHEKEAKKMSGLDAKIKQALIESGFGKEVNGKQQVDWKKFTTDSKNVGETIGKIRDALKGKGFDSMIDTVEKRAEQLLSEKKAAAVKTKINQINRYKARRITNIFRRNTRIENLVEIWKQGGLSEKAILEKLGEDFGFTQFTDANEKWIEDKIKEIDAAPEGAEKELLEEQLHAYLEDLGAPMIAMTRILEKNKARLLSGFITSLQNLTGTGDAMAMVTYKAIINQINTKGFGDKEVSENY